jgi:hypothetical protein
MFGNAEYSMLFRSDTLVENTPHTIQYRFRDGPRHRLVNKTFDNFSDLEAFALEERRKRKIFQVLRAPDSPFYGEIIEHRCAIRAMMYGEELVSLTDSYIVPKRAKPAPNPNVDRKEAYAPFDDSVPEGETAKKVFFATEFKRLKRNYTLVTGKNPLEPAQRTVRVYSVWGSGFTEHIVSHEFQTFALEEFETHEKTRVLRGEEKSNCFKVGASMYWDEEDCTSLQVNSVVLPPKGDFYMPALGSN